MSTLRKTDQIVAIACSDIHLSQTPPIARAGEPDWYAAMARPLRELQHLQDKYKCPVICAGDIFDHWKAPPELINFAINELPRDMIAIPGQHDLPYHSLADLHKSAFATLVGAKRIKYLHSTWNYPGKFHVHGFPWGVPVRALDMTPGFNIAVVHEYTWVQGTGHPEASENAMPTPRKYGKFDLAIVGDNHKPFECHVGGCYLVNCGGFMLRKSDDNHRPRVILIYGSGKTERHFLDTSADRFEPVRTDTGAPDVNLENFLDHLKELQDKSLDFNDVMSRTLMDRSVNEKVRRIIMEAMERGKH